MVVNRLPDKFILVISFNDEKVSFRSDAILKIEENRLIEVAIAQAQVR